jgi:dihydroorotate dehydrogenase
MLYRLLRPAVFALDAEQAHRLTVAALKLWGPAAPDLVPGPLAIEVAGLHFPNPLGMAAGFDKDAEVPDALLALGFGFAEVGSITPRRRRATPGHGCSGLWKMRR